VVQDVTGEEGTGIWSNTEAIERHIPAPTLNVAHAFRLASAYLGDRECAEKTMGDGLPPQKTELSKIEKAQFLESLRKSVYAACLVSFIQGLNVIDAANKEHKWEIDYAAVVQIWKAGCIIEADYIPSEILAPVLTDKNRSADNINLLFSQRAMQDVKKCFLSLRKVVAKCVETDQVVPAPSASLEYFKIATGTDLPRSSYEVELDYFGHHMLDKKGEEIEGPTEREALV
jgi:6-phosphogluconate dehydrogenase